MAWPGEPCNPSTSFPPPAATAGCSHLFPNALSGLVQILDGLQQLSLLGEEAAGLLLRFPWSEYSWAPFMSVWCPVESCISGENGPMLTMKTWMRLWWDCGSAPITFPYPRRRRRAVPQLLHGDLVPAAAPMGRNRFVSSASLFYHSGSRVVEGELANHDRHFCSCFVGL